MIKKTDAELMVQIQNVLEFCRNQKTESVIIIRPKQNEVFSRMLHGNATGKLYLPKMELSKNGNFITVDD